MRRTFSKSGIMVLLFSISLYTLLSASVVAMNNDDTTFIEFYVLSTTKQGDKPNFIGKLKRTQEVDGRKIDEVTFTSQEVTELITNAILEKAIQIKIKIPDERLDVEVIHLTLPRKLTENLITANLNVDIVTAQGRLFIPSHSFEGVEEDVRISMKIMNDPVEIDQWEEIIRNNFLVEGITGKAHTAEIQGRPWEINSDFQNREVKLYFPIDLNTLNRKQRFELQLFSLYANGQLSLDDGKIISLDEQDYFEVQSNVLGTFTLITAPHKNNWIWWVIFPSLLLILLIIVVMEIPRHNKKKK